jgi:hypothetical protein
MAVNQLIQYIGQSIFDANPYVDMFTANTKQFGGQDVQFHGRNKTYSGITDIVGCGFYIRLGAQPAMQQLRALSSCRKEFEVIWPMRLVLFSVNNQKEIDAQRVALKLASDLKNINFRPYTGSERKIKCILQNVNVDPHLSLKEEINADMYVGEDPVIVIVSAQLRYLLTSDCEPCDVELLDPCENGLSNA